MNFSPCTANLPEGVPESYPGRSRESTKAASFLEAPRGTLFRSRTPENVSSPGRIRGGFLSQRASPESFMIPIQSYQKGVLLPRDFSTIYGVCFKKNTIYVDIFVDILWIDGRGMMKRKTVEKIFFPFFRIAGTMPSRRCNPVFLLITEECRHKGDVKTEKKPFLFFRQCYNRHHEFL
jgi:hypothetical protein